MAGLTNAEWTALQVANAAAMTPDGSYDLLSTVVRALGSAQLLQSPETAAEHEALVKRVAELEDAPLPAWVQDLGDELPDFLSDLAPAAISYYDEDTPDDAVLAQVARAFAAGRDRATERLADLGPVCPVCQDPPCHCSCFGKAPAPHCSHGAKKLDKANFVQPVPSELTVYRAQHDSIPMGLYTTAAEARAHCVAEERRTWADGTPLVFNWIEDEEDGVAELVIVNEDGDDETGTGYLVTALTVASAYDEEADE